MRAIIAGGGNVGRHLAFDLVERGHEVTLIEQDPQVLKKAQAASPNVELGFWNSPATKNGTG